MVKNEWGFNSEIKMIGVKGTDTIVVAIEDINPKVAERIIELHNSGQDSAIKSFLESTSMLSVDEKEFLEEQLASYFQLVVQEQPKIASETPSPKPSDSLPTLEQWETTKKEEPEVKKEEKVKKTRATSTVSKMVTPAKVLESIEDQIKALQEKRVAIGWLTSLDCAEIPEDFSYTNKKLLAEFQRKSAELANEYIEKIQNS